MNLGLYTSIDIAASGLTSQRLRLDVIANNLANINTTRTPKGGAYRRQQTVFYPRGNYPSFIIPFFQTAISPNQMGEGVRVVSIKEDPSPLRLVYDPSHPDANPSGYVEYPNVNPVTEMVDMISATRAYEANVQIIQSAKSMAERALQIGG